MPRRNQKTAKGKEPRALESDRFWSAECLLDEQIIKGKLKYLVKWEGRDRNGKDWDPTWEPPCNISDDLIMEWNSKKYSMEMKSQNVIEISSIEDNIDSSDGNHTPLISECESILNNKSAEFQTNQAFLKFIHEISSRMEDGKNCELYSSNNVKGYKRTNTIKEQQREHYRKIFDKCEDFIEYLNSSNDTLNKEVCAIKTKLEEEIKKGDPNVGPSVIKLESLQEEYNNINDLKKVRDGYIKEISSAHSSDENSEPEFSSEEHAELISLRLICKNLEENIKLEGLCELIQQKPIPSEEIQKIRQVLGINNTTNQTNIQSVQTAPIIQPHPTNAATTIPAANNNNIVPTTTYPPPPPLSIPVASASNTANFIRNNIALLNNVAPQHLSTPSPPHTVVMSMSQLHQILQQPNTLLTNPVTSAAIPVTTSTGVISILYDAFPSQCKQCGIRFAKDSKDGGGKIGKHLDWHFRQNLTILSKMPRGHKVETDSDFQNGNTPTFFEYDTSNFKLNKRTNGIGDGSGTSRSKKAKIDHNNKNDIDNLISESTVIVPLDIQKTNKPCPICKEKFQMFWNDNEEEWMYRNAMEINGDICHVTCHSDAIKLNVLLVRDG
ncbi:4998_t:CDS:10 [Entrophospora sp. SA101]|nr:4998_t:CDS:10 [Entrophospora sp. SA101]